MSIINEANNSYQLEELSDDDPDYLKLKSIVESSKSRKLDVTSISQIHNPSLIERYENAKQLKSCIFPNLREELLLHGTSVENVDSICIKGLDPGYCVDTLHGEQVVNLTESSAMASNYPEPIYLDSDRFMFACRVLIGKPKNWQSIDGSSDIFEDHDTIIKNFDYFENGIVYKRQAEDILPEFLIKYSVE